MFNFIKNIYKDLIKLFIEEEISTTTIKIWNIGEKSCQKYLIYKDDCLIISQLKKFIEEDRSLFNYSFIFGNYILFIDKIKLLKITIEHGTYDINNHIYTYKEKVYCWEKKNLFDK